MTLRQLRGFLGITGYCRIWIPGYGELARPLYKLIAETQQAQTDKLVWSPETQKAFKVLQTALLQAPALSLPTGSEFNLFVTERKGVALGVLTQPRGPHQQPIAYLSRELDVVSRGWPHCLRVIGAVALLAPEALKIINGRNLTVLTSHDVSGILNSKVNIWMTDSRLLKYQSLLLEGPVTKLKVCGNLNPATFLPEKENETPDHDCSQFLTLNYAAREDLKDTPLDNPDMEIFTDGSSFVQDGKRKAGYAVVTAEQVLEAKSLPQGTSAQLAELVALTRVKL